MIQEGDLVSHYDREYYSMGIVTSVLEFEDAYEPGLYMGFCQVHWCAGDNIIENVTNDGDWYEFGELRLLSRTRNIIWPDLSTIY
tara:strand:+ start:861 stop:1115 length:255 start_codon:yes stop_codon:yes gene_type:complete